jgi:hypothetical protein
LPGPFEASDELARRMKEIVSSRDHKTRLRIRHALLTIADLAAEIHDVKRRLVVDSFELEDLFAQQDNRKGGGNPGGGKEGSVGHQR